LDPEARAEVKHPGRALQGGVARASRISTARPVLLFGGRLHAQPEILSPLRPPGSRRSFEFLPRFLLPMVHQMSAIPALASTKALAPPVRKSLMSSWDFLLALTS
jgi:hypothetical protein